MYGYTMYIYTVYGIYIYMILIINIYIHIVGILFRKDCFCEVPIGAVDSSPWLLMTGILGGYSPIIKTESLCSVDIIQIRVWSRFRNAKVHARNRTMRVFHEIPEGFSSPL